MLNSRKESISFSKGPSAYTIFQQSSLILSRRASVEVGENRQLNHHPLTIADEDRPSSQDLSRGHTGSHSSPHDPILSSRPATYTIDRALDLYFAHCHRQPLWLFRDRESLTAEDCPEEILFPILALASCLVPADSPLAQCPGFKECCDIARTLIMSQIMNESVAFPTLQSLCLLAFASFVGEPVSDTRAIWQD